MDPPSSSSSSSSPCCKNDWIHLQEGKEFSRLLYPNPVCLLCTPPLLRSNANDDDDDDDDDNDQHQPYLYPGNVMTISWLTPTNNHGAFVMSLNRHRFTANYLQHPGREFCLSVPIATMADMVLAVGGTSGHHGNKFQNDEASMEHRPSMSSPTTAVSVSASETNATTIPSTKTPISKRAQKRRHRETLQQHGIPGLIQVPFGSAQGSDGGGGSGGGSNPTNPANPLLFGIQGTVAHLRCTSFRIDQNAVDDEHYLIFAKVLDAYCHPCYWDGHKKLFGAKGDDHPPFLTFLGSQTFGYTTTTTTTSTTAPTTSKGEAS